MGCVAVGRGSLAGLGHGAGLKRKGDRGGREAQDRCCKVLCMQRQGGD